LIPPPESDQQAASNVLDDPKVGCQEQDANDCHGDEMRPADAAVAVTGEPTAEYVQNNGQDLEEAVKDADNRVGTVLESCHH
jgi:hypothetical protein